MTEREMEAWERFAAATLTGRAPHFEEDVLKVARKVAEMADAMLVEWRKRYQPPVTVEAMQQPVAAPTCWCGVPAKHVIRHRLRHTVEAKKFQLCDGHLAAYRACLDVYEGEQFLIGEREASKG